MHTTGTVGRDRQDGVVCRCACRYEVGRSLSSATIRWGVIAEIIYYWAHQETSFRMLHHEFNLARQKICDWKEERELLP